MGALLRDRLRIVSLGWLTRSRRTAEENVMRELDDITGTIVDASLRIHRYLGPDLLE
jgi:hypothetical protein